MRSAGRVARGFGHQIEFPDDLAGLCVERIHAPLHALVVSAGIADEDEAVPGDRGGRCRLAEFRVRDCRFPNSLAGFEVVSQHPPVLGAAKQQAVHVGGAAIDRQKAGGFVVLMRAPILVAIGGVERENIVFGQCRSGRRSPSMIRPSLEAGVLLGVVGAQNLQLANILRIDLAKLRVTLRSERFVVARPVPWRSRSRRCAQRGGRGSQRPRHLSRAAAHSVVGRAWLAQTNDRTIVDRHARKWDHLIPVGVTVPAAAAPITTSALPMIKVCF